VHTWAGALRLASARGYKSPLHAHILMKTLGTHLVRAVGHQPAHAQSLMTTLATLLVRAVGHQPTHAQPVDEAGHAPGESSRPPARPCTQPDDDAGHAPGESSRPPARLCTARMSGPTATSGGENSTWMGSASGAQSKGSGREVRGGQSMKIRPSSRLK